LPNAPKSFPRVAALHRQLSRRSTNGTYYPSCRDSAKAFPGLGYQTASTADLALAQLGVWGFFAEATGVQAGQSLTVSVSVARNPQWSIRCGGGGVGTLARRPFPCVRRTLQVNKPADWDLAHAGVEWVGLARDRQSSAWAELSYFPRLTKADMNE
jgi:hypothetical protein